MQSDASQCSLLDWGVAARALAGQTTSGDRYLVQPYAGGVLVAVVDGLGHGEEAADAAERTLVALREQAHAPVVSLLKRCHTALEGTRGVVMSLASFQGAESVMEWVGVGDVEGVLLRGSADAGRAREYIVQRGGVVGFRLPPVQAALLPVTPGDTLIFATDGVSRSFTEEPPESGPPELIATRLLARHAKATDDALILVARYRGANP